MKEESTRQLKVSRLLQRDLADIFQKELGNELPGKMITVTKVKVSPDLALAKCYVSVFPDKGSRIVDYLNTHTGKLRFKLGNRIRNQLRIVPELVFYLDDSLDYMENIDRLLNE